MRSSEDLIRNTALFIRVLKGHHQLSLLDHFCVRKPADLQSAGQSLQQLSRAQLIQQLARSFSTAAKQPAENNCDPVSPYLDKFNQRLIQEMKLPPQN